MKTIKTYVFEKLKLNPQSALHKNPQIKIPKKLYYDEILLGKDISEQLINEFDEYFEPAQIKNLFKGDENTFFKVIYWNGNSGGYQDASDALEELFGEYGWIDGWCNYADYFEFIDEDSNTALGKFTSENGKVINVIDTGDNGYVYTCIEK